jgi:hypothetical protein
MIGDTIQAALQKIIPNSFAEVMEEEEIVPYCLHTEKETPDYLKEGIEGYTYTSEVFIVDRLPDNVKNLSISVITALVALSNTTFPETEDIDENEIATVIDNVSYDGDEPGFDPETRLFGNMLTFTIETKTR